MAYETDYGEAEGEPGRMWCVYESRDALSYFRVGLQNNPSTPVPQSGPSVHVLYCNGLSLQSRRRPNQQFG
jgi:hypothetical protein